MCNRENQNNNIPNSTIANVSYETWIVPTISYYIPDYSEICQYDSIGVLAPATSKIFNFQVFWLVFNFMLMLVLGITLSKKDSLENEGGKKEEQDDFCLKTVFKESYNLSDNIYVDFKLTTPQKLQNLIIKRIPIQQKKVIIVLHISCQ